jgi:hypothetical protein
LAFAHSAVHILTGMGKPPYFNELNNEARRRLIDVQQRAAALREAVTQSAAEPEAPPLW